MQGGSGNFGRLTRDVLLICAALMEEKPMTKLLAPLLLAVPVVTFLNYATEEVFARHWGSRWERRQGLRGAPTRGMRPASGEAAA